MIKESVKRVSHGKMVLFCVKEVFFFNSWSHKNLVGERSRGSCPQSELSNRPLLQLIIKIVCLKKESQALRAENGKKEKEKKIVLYIYIYIKGKRGTAEIDFGAIYGPLWGPGTVAWFFLGYHVGI